MKLRIVNKGRFITSMAFILWFIVLVVATNQLIRIGAW